MIKVHRLCMETAGKAFEEEVRVELGIERCLGTHQVDKCWGRTF